MQLPELNIDRVLTDRQQLIRIVGNRLFVALAIALVLASVWVLIVVGGLNANVGALPAVLFVGVVGGLIGLQNRLVTLDDGDLLLLAKSTTYLLLAPLVGGFLAVLLFVLFISGLLQGDMFPKFSADTVIQEVTEAPGNQSAPNDIKNEVDASKANKGVDVKNGAEAPADPAPLEKSPNTAATQNSAESTKNGEGKQVNSPDDGIKQIFNIHGEGPEDYAKLIFWCFLAGFSERFVTKILGRFENSATSAAGESK